MGKRKNVRERKSFISSYYKNVAGGWGKIIIWIFLVLFSNSKKEMKPSLLIYQKATQKIYSNKLFIIVLLRVKSEWEWERKRMVGGRKREKIKNPCSIIMFNFMHCFSLHNCECVCLFFFLSRLRWKEGEGKWL